MSNIKNFTVLFGAILIIIFASNVNAIKMAIPSIKNIQSIKIYSLPWTLLTRTTLSPDQVRQRSFASFSSSYKPVIHDIINTLRKAPCKKSISQTLGDPRKVIDIVQDGHKVTTILLDSTGYWLEGSDIRCELDKDSLVNINLIFY